jgi:hypothetical protein
MLATKSQASVEFLSFFTIFIMASGIYAFIYYSDNIELLRERGNYKVRSFVKDISTAINIAVIEGDGYISSFSLPERIESYTYSVEIDQSLVTLVLNRERNSTFFSNIITENVTGNFDFGENVIKNIGGGIKIE